MTYDLYRQFVVEIKISGYVKDILGAFPITQLHLVQGTNYF